MDRLVDGLGATPEIGLSGSRVGTVTGRVFVAKTPEAFACDDDGNLLSDGRLLAVI